MSRQNQYDRNLAHEAEYWAARLKVETTEQAAWLDHALVNAHYHERARIDGLPWQEWITAQLGGPAQKSMELGCGSGDNSLSLFERGRSRWIDGIDASAGRLAAGEARRAGCRAPGAFRVADANALILPPDTYDLIFSSHSFHHFLALEQVMEQVHQALTLRGFFVLEEFVGPTQFQWTDHQIELVRALTALLPERLRVFKWGAVKSHEGRPTPAEVVAVSPFESIRSGEIAALFQQRFQTVTIRRLGGTVQHLLYNGIIHNFASADDEEACRYLRAIWAIEDTLIDSELLPSDFLLLVGQRRRAAPG